MAKYLTSNLLVFIGALLYNFIFWNEKMGVNTLIFTIFIIGALYQLHSESFDTRAVRVTAIGTLCLAVLVVWHNSLIAKTIYILSLMSMIGFVQQREIRFLGYALFLYLGNLLEIPQHTRKAFKNMPLAQSEKNTTKILQLMVVPTFILPFFYAIYCFANPKFAELSSIFWGKVFSFLSFDWHWSRLFFFITGIFAVGAALWTYTMLNLAEEDQKYSLDLHPIENQRFSMWGMDENTAYISAIFLLTSLNILVFFNNILDVNYVWRGDVSKLSAWELKQYVHEGTYFLIFGILMAISVVMYLFKGSLNFLENIKLVKYLAFLWLAQNIFLTLSVGVRNWQYIDYYGLAYKRVGVMAFLMLVLYGL